MKKLLIALLCATLQFLPMLSHAAGNADKETDLAAAAYQAGDYQQAIAHFRKVVKASPKDAMAWHFLGQSLAKSGDIAGAKKAYERVLQLQPNTPVAERTQTLLDNLEAVVNASMEDRLGISVSEVGVEKLRELHIENPYLSHLSGGLMVNKVGGDAARAAGVQPGDILLEAGNKPVPTISKFNEILKAIPLKKKIVVLIFRGSETSFVAIKLDSI